jgi:hypothetical protein
MSSSVYEDLVYKGTCWNAALTPRPLVRDLMLQSAANRLSGVIKDKRPIPI